MAVAASKPDKTSFMKKAFLVVGLALAVTVTASAQNKKKEPPPPPEPPQPPAVVVHEIPPPPPPPPPLPLQEDFPDDYKAFLKRNPSVKSLGWTFQNELIIRLKSGKEERYQLNEKASRAAAEAKYGQFPAAPPPPPKPPVPPKPPRAPEPEYQ